MSRSEKQPLNKSRKATSPNYAAIAVGVGAAFALVALAVAASGGAAGLRGSGVAVASLSSIENCDVQGTNEWGPFCTSRRGFLTIANDADPLGEKCADGFYASDAGCCRTNQRNVCNAPRGVTARRDAISSGVVSVPASTSFAVDCELRVIARRHFPRRPLRAHA